MVIIDYLQLMSGSSFGNRGGRYENRQNEISAISRSLKIMAKELDIPVVALSQLSRAPEQRKDDHRPQLSDLRESGSIEQDADLVLFVYRHDVYRKKELNSSEDSGGPDAGPDLDGLAELIIGKQRNGPTGTVKLVFFDKYTRFDNYTDQAPW
jgi:replicative DNA helicase